MAQAPVMIMAGGTGGHVFPGLAVAEVLIAQGVPVVWLGAVGGMEARLVPARGIEFEGIAIQGLRGKGWARLLAAPFLLLRALWQALMVLRRRRPRSVLSMGGFAAGPGGIAAFLLGRPLLVHEQNAIAGWTNRILARLARAVLTGFARSLPPKGEWLGNPVRAAIAELPPPAQRMAARGERLHLLVLGGSQGARALNRVLPQALAQMAAEQRPKVWHQSGERLHQETLQAYAEAGVEARVTPFIEDMAAAYAWADLAVCRAGALTLAELCGAGLGALLVPYPHAVDDHQTANAQSLAAVGAAELWPESSLEASRLAARLQHYSAARRELIAMAESARALGRPQAAADVARRCLEVVA